MSPNRFLPSRAWFVPFALIAACGGNGAGTPDGQSVDTGTTADHAPATDVPGTDAQPGDDAFDSGSMDAAGDTATDSVTDGPASGETGRDVPIVAMDSGTDVPVVVDTGTDVPLPSLDAPGDPDAGSSTAGTCALAGDEPIVANAGDSRFVSLVWTGTEFGAAWEDDEPGDDEIYFARIAADGTVLGHAQITVDPNDDAHPSLTHDATGYAVAWSDTPGDGSDPTTPGMIRFARIPGDELTRAADGGVAQVTAVDVLASARPGVAQPSLLALPASAGGGFALAWEDGRNGATNHEIYYARLDASGHPASEIRFTNAASTSYYPLLAWNDARGELGLVWLDARDDAASAYPNEELYFARMTPAGARPSGAADVRVTHDTYRSIWPSVTYDGTGYGIVWANEDAIPDAPHIFFRQLDADGAPRGTAGIVALSHNPEGVGAWANGIAFNGSEYLTIWEDQRHATGDLVAQRLAPDGTRLTGEVFLHHDTFFTSHPSLVRAGANWGMAWEDERGGQRDVYFRALGRTDCLTATLP